MTYSMDELLDELAQPRRKVWITDDDSVIDAAPGASEPTPAPTVRDEPVDELPRPSAPIASADASFRPERASGDEGGGYDWRRMLASLFGGREAVSDLDRRRLSEAQQKLAERRYAEESQSRRAADSRAAEKWEMDKSLYPGKAAKLGAETEQLGAKTASKALAIGGSPESAAMRESVAQRFDAMAANMGNSEWGPRYAQAAQNLRSNKAMSGMAALDLAKQWNVTVDDIARDAAAGARASASGRAVAERERHNRAMEGMAGQKIEAKVQGNQEKLNEKVESLDNMEELLAEATDAKKNVDVGPLATTINKARQYTPWRNKDFNTLQQLMQSVNNEITNLRSGKAVSAGEEARLRRELADLESLQDDPTFEDKLAGFRRILAGYKKRAVNQYQRVSGGGTVDKSNTAREATMQATELSPGEREASAPAPWPGAQPGQRKRDKRTGIVWEMQADGTLRAVQ